MSDAFAAAAGYINPWTVGIGLVLLLAGAGVDRA